MLFIETKHYVVPAEVEAQFDNWIEKEFGLASGHARFTEVSEKRAIKSISLGKVVFEFVLSSDGRFSAYIMWPSDFSGHVRFDLLSEAEHMEDVAEGEK